MSEKNRCDKCYIEVPKDTFVCKSCKAASLIKLRVTSFIFILLVLGGSFLVLWYESHEMMLLSKVSKLAIVVVCIILSVKHAKELGRSKILWGVLAIIFGAFSLLILSFLKTAEVLTAREKSKRLRIILISLTAVIVLPLVVIYASYAVSEYLRHLRYEKIQKEKEDSAPARPIPEAYLVEIDFSKFKDESLRRCVSYDGRTKVVQVGDLRCSGVSDTSGIEQLTELYRLDLYENQISTIDLSANTNLRYVNLSRNKLTNIDVSKNTVLSKLILSSNTLTAIDVSNNPSLEWLSVDANELTTIDVSANANLKNLYLEKNQIPCSEIKELITRFTSVQQSHCIKDELIR